MGSLVCEIDSQFRNTTVGLGIYFTIIVIIYSIPTPSGICVFLTARLGVKREAMLGLSCLPVVY